MSMPNPKAALFAQFALVAKSLGHAHRLELLEQLAQGERSVEVLADRTGLSIANASQHLQQMRRAGLVSNRRDGKFIYYRLADDKVLDLLAALRGIARHQAQGAQGGLVHRISHRVVSIVLNGNAIRRLAVAARPLIATLRDDQKQSAMMLAQEMGLGPVLAALN